MVVAVGSTNPVKIDAVKKAFAAVWPEEKIVVKSVAVVSEVSAQPMSDEESIKGATMRAKQALERLQADFGVGLEGGLHKIGNHWFDSGWMVVVDKHGIEGIGSTIRMHLSEKIMQHVHRGKELGDATDAVFGTVNSKQANGHFGLMTKNLITRTSGYTDGIIAALARFIQPEAYRD